MRTFQAQKLDVSVGRGPKSWTCPYVFNDLEGAVVNYKLTARVQFREERKSPRAENENRPAFHDWDAA